jgi:hypothetical protein
MSGRSAVPIYLVHFKLPVGFSPLRAGREGQRVAVIGALEG